MNLSERIAARLAAIDLIAERGCCATRGQAEVELMVALAEECMPVLRLDGEAPEALRLHLIDLAALLSDRCEGEARVVEIRVGTTRLASTGVMLSKDPVVVLVTHASLTASLAGRHLRDDQLVDDGQGPAPLAALDGPRARTFFRGMLRLVEREARRLARGDDCNWGDEDGQGDPHWHPDELARRARRLRREEARLRVVREVHES